MYTSLKVNPYIQIYTHICIFTYLGILYLYIYWHTMFNNYTSTIRLTDYIKQYKVRF